MEKEKKFFIFSFIFSIRRTRDTIENFENNFCYLFFFNLRILRIRDLKFTIFLSRIFVHENDQSRK